MRNSLQFAIKTVSSLYQDCRHGGYDGGGPEPVADHGEVREVSLDGGVHDGCGPGVAERRPVLVQEIHQLLADEIGLEQELFPPVDL